jgi:hypothetical protein
MGLELPTIALIASLVGTVGSTVATGVALSKGAPDLPPLAPPPPPPPPPPTPLPVKPPPPDLEVDPDRRKRTSRFGISDTLLANPLGSEPRTATGGKSLLGGG